MGKDTPEQINYRLIAMKFVFAAWVLVCVLLITLFCVQIQHGRNMDKIWDKYDQDMAELHASY